MPTYKYQFKGPEYVEHTIIDHDRNVVGTIRLKPSSVMWKPKGAKNFYQVTVDKFDEWITSRNRRRKQ
jgi:hypothetical protein